MAVVRSLGGSAASPSCRRRRARTTLEDFALSYFPYHSLTLPGVSNDALSHAGACQGSWTLDGPLRGWVLRLDYLVIPH